MPREPAPAQQGTSPFQEKRSVVLTATPRLCIFDGEQMCILQPGSVGPICTPGWAIAKSPMTCGR